MFSFFVFSFSILPNMQTPWTLIRLYRCSVSTNSSQILSKYLQREKKRIFETNNKQYAVVISPQPLIYNIILKISMTKTQAKVKIPNLIHPWFRLIILNLVVPNTECVQYNEYFDKKIIAILHPMHWCSFWSLYYVYFSNHIGDGKLKIKIQLTHGKIWVRMGLMLENRPSGGIDFSPKPIQWK